MADTEPKTFTKTITRDLDDATSAKLGRELCQLLDEIEVAQNYRKEFNADMKEKLSGLSAKAKEAKAAIEAGKVEEHVECYEVHEFETSSVKTLRKDTNEVVDTRAMTADERRKAMQLGLPITGDGGGPDGKDGKVLPFGHNHEDKDVYTEGCTACWSQRARSTVIDDETAMAESVGPGNELPPAEPTDEELDDVDANFKPTEEPEVVEDDAEDDAS